MGDNEDAFSVKISDQTASAPAAPAEAAEADPPLQIDSPDNIALPAPADTSSDGDQSAPAQPSEDSGDFNVDVSVDTARSGYQPPVNPQVTMGPNYSSDAGAGDDRPEEQHDEERDDINEKIEEDSSREADPEPPSGE